MKTASRSMKPHPSGTSRKALVAAPLAAMLAALEWSGSERVLEIGACDAKQAALLARLVREVVSLESKEDGATERRRLLAALGCENVRVVVGPATTGFAAAGPYQVILVGAGVCDLPTGLLDQLADGGKLLIPLGSANGQVMQLLEKQANGVTTRALGPCYLEMLPGEDRIRSSYPWTG